MNGRTGQRRKTNRREKNKKRGGFTMGGREICTGKNVNRREKQLIMKIFAK